MGTNTCTIAHALQSQLKHKNVHNTNIKTLEQHRTYCKWGLLQTSLDVSEHPANTSKPKYELSTGSVVCLHSINFLQRFN